MEELSNFKFIRKNFTEKELYEDLSLILNISKEDLEKIDMLF